MKTYMIIEHYKPGKAKEIYARFRENVRMLPAGVQFIDSWVEENLQKCYQVMKSESIEGINLWVDQWKDLVEFEVIPVLNTSEANDLVKSNS
ncbi:MAG: DUF3303 family protein [Bacteroidota bacterium]